MGAERSCAAAYFMSELSDLLREWADDRERGVVTRGLPRIEMLRAAATEIERLTPIEEAALDLATTDQPTPEQWEQFRNALNS